MSSLFSEAELPLMAAPEPSNFLSLKHPVWTEEKARLIQEYLRLFTFVTKHGVYVDGFAAPQRRDRAEICSASLVLETEPKWIRTFVLCDIDVRGLALLEQIAGEHRTKTRRIEVILGDFNSTVDTALARSKISAKTATFALLDQRTFECHWATVEKLARYKATLSNATTKIELFYFLASGWLDRSIAAVRRADTSEKLARWWGADDWIALKWMQGIPRANLLAQRFKDELGYKHVRSYAIHSKKRKGRTMYHMIHATDHDEAATLMLRAYRKISGRPEAELPEKQIDMEALWTEAQGCASTD